MIEITSQVSYEDLVDTVCNGCGEEDPLKFIIDVDSSIADQGFTIEVIGKLTESLLSDCQEHHKYLSEKQLDEVFGPGSTNYERLGRLDKELESNQKQEQILSNIVRMIKELDDITD